MNSSTTVVVALSGGVDSSVAALLLKEAGYRVIGVTMKLYSLEQTELPSHYRGCCTVDDVEDARAVCRRLGVPHYVLNVQTEFRTHVIDYFTSEYASGRTPHPCIACNDKIKFSFLMERARALDAEFVATGHYARVEQHDGEFRLLKAVDHSKDQSYVLFGVGQNQLSHMLMPVGHYPKEEIRRMALEAELPNADKPDSQDICFIPLGDYREFLSQRLQGQPGRIVDTAGNTLGEHQGIHLFTVGQRRGLGVKSSHPMYVIAIDAEAGDVVVGLEEGVVQRHPVGLGRQLCWLPSSRRPHRSVGEDPLQGLRSPCSPSPSGNWSLSPFRDPTASSNARPSRGLLQR